jgi:hypothetical protein
LVDTSDRLDWPDNQAPLQERLAVRDGVYQAALAPKDGREGSQADYFAMGLATGGEPFSQT